MKTRTRGVVLLAVIIAITATSTVSALAMEWHETSSYAFSVGEPAEIYFWAGDGTFVCFYFDWNGGSQIEITAEANRPVLGIQKVTEFQRTISPTQPYNSMFVGEWTVNPWEMEADETMVQFYWADSPLHPQWEYNTCVMDAQVEERKWSARFEITTNSSVMLIEEWSSY